ncbi:MAG: FAD-dependent oxidoreductase, partial [Actinobacteria bacterium]|nr:FAD-dependent oxidoreductase [Actinomycetota bacterium]
MRTVEEAARRLPVMEEVDVLVAGGGPAGIAAAVAAARNGARVLLLERYGCLGGQATGGLIVNFNLMDDGTRPTVKGIAQEVLDRLAARQGTVAPPEEDRYSRERGAVNRWKRWGFTDGSQVRYCVQTEPEALKDLVNEMVTEAGAELLLHTWAVHVLKEGDAVVGAVVESKAGRQAVLAKVAIDATGDADLAAFAGAPFEVGRMHTNLVYRLGGVDTERALRFQEEHPQEYDAILREMGRQGASHLGWTLTGSSGIVHCSSAPFHDIDILNPDDLSRGEVVARQQIQLRL